MMLEGTIALFETPCYKQWEGFNGALALYGFTMSTEARRRNLKTDRAFFSKRLPKGDFSLPDFDVASDELGHE